MSYSVEQLASVEECDAVLSLITKSKSDIAYKQGLLQHRQNVIGESSVDIAAELVSVNALFDAFEGLAETLPAGKKKEENARNLENARHRKAQLTSRLAEQGSVALLDIELDLAGLTVQSAELDAAITSINARKATL